jgi:hypothetical protein
MSFSESKTPEQKDNPKNIPSVGEASTQAMW